MTSLKLRDWTVLFVVVMPSTPADNQIANGFRDLYTR
jgi:hypothetical protein